MEVGKCYLVQSVTSYYYVGRVKELHPFAVTLEEAAWIADTGRLHEFIAKGKAAGMEVEPVGEWTVQYAGYGPWPHKLFEKAV